MEERLNFSDDELEALLLAQATASWQKIAMIIGRAMIENNIWDDNRLGDRITALVDAGKLESAGNIRKWRFSEVRLP